MKFSFLRVITAVALVGYGFFGAGCASLPSQFADENPPLSTADQNIVVAAATIRQDIQPAELVIETAAPLVLQEVVKTPATQQRDGLFGYELGVGLTGFTSVGNTVPKDIVASTALTLNTSLSTSTDTVLQTVITDAQAPITSEVTQLETLANSATNPDVKTYVLATIPIVINGIGVALETSFASYAPSTTAATALLEKQRLYYAGVKKHGRIVMLTMANDPAMTEKALEDYRNW